MNNDEGLKRVIGIPSLTANAVNLTIGAGIFALPAVVAIHLGAAAFWAYLICALLLGLVLMCFINVGTKITTSGGAYSYVEAAFGPLAGFLTNTMQWFGFAVITDAAICNVLADNLAIFFPVFHLPVYRVLLFAFIFGSLAFLNIRGVRESSRFVFGITLAKLIPLFLLIGVGWFFVESKNLAVADFPTPTSLGEGALLLFFAFGGGAESVLSATGEISNPKKTIPIGLMLGILIILFVYLSIQLVSQGVLGDLLANQGNTPLVAVSEAIFGPFGIKLMVLATVISCFGCVSGDVLVTSRLPYAAARDGLLPSFLAKLHPTFATPYQAIILYTFIGFIVSASGGFRQLAILSSAALLLIYTGVILSAIKLRNIDREKSFNLPGGILIPLLALVATGWFLSNLALKEVLSVSVFLIFFTGMYFLLKRSKRRRK